jgi:DNA-binding transcriptional LysR family regulator
MNLLAVAAFNSVAAHGGFGRASRVTGQPKTTLSRRIRELEESLGLRLIERGRQSIRLTEEGAAFHARTSALLGEIEEAAKDVSTGLSSPRGSLRVSAPTLLIDVAMGRVAADFIARFPEVQLEFVCENRVVDLVAEGYDAAIRINPKPGSDLVGHCFLHDRTLVVATPAVCRRHGADGSKARTPMPAVVLSGAPDTTWRVSRHGRIVTISPEPVLRLSSLNTMRGAILAGAGAGLLPHSIVASDLAAGRLEALGEVADRSDEVWVLHTSRRLTNPKVTAFVQFLREAFPDGVLR